MEQNEQLIAWLRDAQAMEESVGHVLSRQVTSAREHPEIQQRLQRHLDETRRHASSIGECLGMLGAKSSPHETRTSGFIATMRSMFAGTSHDELVKDAIADYAIVHFEIACYSSIIAAAEDAGNIAIARTCGEILREKVAMANWLEEHIPAATRLYLHAAPA